MAEDNVLKVQIQLDDGTVKQGFVKIQEEGENTFRRIGEVAAGVLASQVITTAVNTIKNTFEEAIGSAAAYGQELQKLNGNLALSGQYSATTSKQFTDLADKIQATTAFSDDQVLSIAALGSNFTHSAEQTRKLTTATLDFAAATGKDANEAAQQLSLTLQGNIGRLGRYFPQLKEFTASQLEAGAAVDFLASRFAGAAVAQSNTYAASVQQLSHAYDDFLKSIGQFITESPTVIGTIKFLASEFLKVAETITAFRGTGDVFDTVARAVVTMGTAINTYAIPPLEILYNFVAQTFSLASSAIRFFVAGVAHDFGAMKAAVESGKQAFAGFGNLVKTPLSDNLEGFLNRYSGALDQAAVKQKTFTNQIKGDVGVAADSVRSIFDTIAPVPLAFGEVMTSFANQYQAAIDKIVETSEQGIGQAATQSFQSFSNAVSSGFAAVGKALVKGQSLFQAFAGALLSGIGQAAIQLGSFYILLGLARAFSTYGLDATAFSLIGVGTALTVLGGALSAFGEGVTGASNPATSVNTGGGSAIETSPGTSSDSAAGISQTQDKGITVNIQGDVLDSRETGLRIVDLLNDSFNASGAKVTYS